MVEISGANNDGWHGGACCMDSIRDANGLLIPLLLTSTFGRQVAHLIIGLILRIMKLHPCHLDD